jgi:uncharacterized membrane protein (DUF4010 family)
MSLTEHGILAAVELAIYVIILFPALYNLKLYGFGKHTGWIFMVIFALGKLLFSKNDST